MPILSIQSFVTYGYVGHSVASFAMQRLGVEVWPIHTTALSCHLGYDGWRGAPCEAAIIDQMIEGIRDIGALSSCEVLLTGYLGSVDHARAAMRALDALGDRPYVCDPVLGDHGALYLPASLVPIYRDEVIPRASVCVPNSFELQLLSGVAPASRAEAEMASARIGATMRPGGVVVATGLAIEEGSQHVLVWREGEVTWVRGPHYPRAFTGSGDLFTACLSALWQRQGGAIETIADAALGATAITASILERTWREDRVELDVVGGQRAFDVLAHPDVWKV